jgi:hypothetical protein
VITHHQIKSAVDTHDTEQISAIVDTLRFRERKNYDECAELFEQAAGIDRDAFEYLMIECDELDGE